VNQHPLTLDGIQAILFDLDGTLRHDRPSYNHAFPRYAAELGVYGSEETRRAALRWAHFYFAGSSEIDEDNHTLGHDEDLFWTNYLRRWLIVYGSAPDRAADLAPALYRRIQQAVQPEDWVDPGTAPILETLTGAGYTLGVVSNRSEAYDDLLAELGLAPFFQFAVASGVVDSWKPDPGIFHHAVELAGTCPERTLYVGDNYYADAVGAQNAGLRAVLFDPEGLFPDAECPAIRSLTELTKALP
jgi:HAD superfamily hydrolase (TIGR01549 family)